MSRVVRQRSIELIFACILSTNYFVLYLETVAINVFQCVSVVRVVWGE